jgi:hypothetical protein
MHLPRPFVAAALAAAFVAWLHPSRVAAAGKTAPVAACPAAATGGPGDVVRALYAAYPFEGTKAIHNEPREVVARYFDEKVVALFLQDQACVAREGGICNVSVDLLHNAQDADIADMRFCASNRGTEWIEVRFKNFGKDHVIAFHLAKTPVGWRIADVVYEGWSLVAALSQPI